jgi:hypothetical protein
MSLSPASTSETGSILAAYANIMVNRPARENNTAERAVSGEAHE